MLTAQKEIAALGHSAGQWIVDKAATTMQTGSRRQVCATCGITLRRETIPVVTVSYDTNYAAYNQPESNDFARWDGSKEVKGSGTVADEVKWIQAALNYCIAYKGLNATPVTVDGTFDASCKAATLAFQKANGLDQDGSFGPNTIAKMKTVVPSTFEQQNIIQYNTSKTGDFLTGSWATYRGSGKYDDTISSSGCGIVALVSAVYNLGDTIEKDKVGTAIKDVFDWAYGKYWIDYTKWTLFAASDEKFGDKYGFNVLETNNTYGCYGQYGKVDTDLSHLVSHLKNNKGTAVVHVYGHFMAAVDYRVFNEKEQILIFDPGPGDMGSSKRGGLTKAEGSWIDLDVLKNGKTASKLNWSTSSSLENIEIDGYWLISKK
ncbi:MAG: peptidoglycan-binding protein [Clostridia bacterium]|nr:peptidoglycan-binding protein [Clostridia bacterium]